MTGEPRDPPERPAEPLADTAPAPVATEAGMYGAPRHPVPEEFNLERGPGAARTALTWLLGALLAGAVALWIGVLSAAQATGESVALPALERAVAALTEIDALLDAGLETVQQQADSGASTLAPPGYPVRDAAVAAAEVTRADGTVDRARLREALLRRSALLVYARGAEAFRNEGADPLETSLLSTSGGIRLLLDNLSPDNHDWAIVALWPLGALCLLLGALLLASARGFARFMALGVALGVAALAVLLGAAAARGALGLVDAAPGDALVREFVAIARQLIALPLRNALWAGAAGVALALPAALLGALFDRSVRRAAPLDARY